MKCVKCGQELPDGAKFCFACGTSTDTFTNKITNSAEFSQSNANVEKGMTDNETKQTQSRITQLKKPKIKIPLLCTLVLGLPLVILGFSEVSDPQRYYTGDGDPVFAGTYLLAFGIMIIIAIWLIYSKSYNRYKLSVDHPEEYATLREQEKRQEYENYKKAQVEKKRQLEITPSCPVCGKKNVKRITTTSRAISIGLTGLASSKIGKQYQCNNCKHMW